MAVEYQSVIPSIIFSLGERLHNVPWNDLVDVLGYIGESWWSTTLTGWLFSNHGTRARSTNCARHCIVACDAGTTILPVMT